MTLHCEIVTQERTVFSQEVDSVNLPGTAGRLGILPHHSPLLTTLRFGEIVIRKNGQEQYFAVSGGFAEIQPDKVIILADAAEHATEINLEQAQKARDEAKKLLAEGVPDDPIRYEQIENALRHAQLQVDVSMRRAPRHRQTPQFDEKD